MSKIISFDNFKYNEWKTPVVITLGVLGGVALVAGAVFAASYSGHGIRAMHGTLAGRASFISAFSAGGAFLISTGAIGIAVKETKINHRTSRYAAPLERNDAEKSRDALNEVINDVFSAEFVRSKAKDKLNICAKCEEKLKAVIESPEKEQIENYLEHLKVKAEEDLEDIRLYNETKDARSRILKNRIGKEYNDACGSRDARKNGINEPINFSVFLDFYENCRQNLKDGLKKVIVENNLDFYTIAELNEFDFDSAASLALHDSPEMQAAYTQVFLSKYSDKEEPAINQEAFLIDIFTELKLGLIIYEVDPSYTVEEFERDDEGNKILKKERTGPAVDHEGKTVNFGMAPGMCDYMVPVSHKVSTYKKTVLVEEQNSQTIHLLKIPSQETLYVLFPPSNSAKIINTPQANI